tara:strand:+ start:516 stop:1040 length:525 start_codon:yes stop_codon:yes gene_type:complete
MTIPECGTFDDDGNLISTSIFDLGTNVAVIQTPVGRCNNSNVAPIAKPGSRLQNICDYEFTLRQTYGDHQLKERRKAEVLQYKKNANNLTRRQEEARLLRGAGRFRKRGYALQNQEITDPNVLDLPLNGNTLICESAEEPCGLTTSSNVPGKQMKLCFNPSVPLINYTVRRTYN